MAKEYRTKTFKSGNSVALRLPKGLGIVEGSEMKVREEQGRYVIEPVGVQRKIDLTGIWGSIPGLGRMIFEDKERTWVDEQPERG